MVRADRTGPDNTDDEEQRVQRRACRSRRAGVVGTGGGASARHRLDAAGEQDERAAAEQLPEALGHHALLLELAAVQLRDDTRPAPYERLCASLHSPSDAARELANRLEGVLPDGALLAGAQLLLSSVERLPEEARDLLTLASRLAHAPVPASFVDRVLAACDDVALDRAGARGTAGRAAARASSLTTATSDGGADMLHPLVSLAVTFADRAAHDRAERLERAAVDVCSAQLGESRPLGLQVERLIVHARQLGRPRR